MLNAAFAIFVWALIAGAGFNKQAMISMDCLLSGLRAILEILNKAKPSFIEVQVELAKNMRSNNGRKNKRGGAVIGVSIRTLAQAQRISREGVRRRAVTNHPKPIHHEISPSAASLPAIYSQVGQPAGPSAATVDENKSLMMESLKRYHVTSRETHRRNQATDARRE